MSQPSRTRHRRMARFQRWLRVICFLGAPSIGACLRPQSGPALQETGAVYELCSDRYDLVHSLWPFVRSMAGGNFLSFPALSLIQDFLPHFRAKPRSLICCSTQKIVKRLTTAQPNHLPRCVFRFPEWRHCLVESADVGDVVSIVIDERTRCALSNFTNCRGTGVTRLAASRSLTLPRATSFSNSGCACCTLCS